VRVLLLTAAALVTVTLAAAASVVSIGLGLRISAPPEPPIAWIAIATVVLVFAGMLASVWLRSRRQRALRKRQMVRTRGEQSLISTTATSSHASALIRAR
jgi:hypothetical protein